MAFGFFKKTQAADIIFYGGHIYTHDPDFPWAEAVACTDTRITAVGDFDAMDQLQGKDTQLVDLKGGYLFPGFIDVHRSPVNRVFDGKYIFLGDCKDKDEICDMVAQWAQAHPDQEIVFGYGYKENFTPEKEDLDRAMGVEVLEACETPAAEAIHVEAGPVETDPTEPDPTEPDPTEPDPTEIDPVEAAPVDLGRPVVLLCENGVTCAINSAAEAIILEAAEEECVDVITSSYILNLLVPFDFEAIEALVDREIGLLCDKGITSVLNLQTPDYFEGLYQDSLIGLYNEGEIKQRFFGSFMLNRPFNTISLVHKLMRRKTTCLEMGNLINAQTVNIYLDKANCPVDFSQESLSRIMLDVADKGFDFYIDAKGYDDLKSAYAALEAIRDKGYKNTVVIASDEVLSDLDMEPLEKAPTAYTTWASDLSALHPVAAKADSVEDAIDQLTIKAAALLGMSDRLGTVERGKWADFAIFSENPLDFSIEDLPNLHAAMTVLDGKIVYDRTPEEED